MQTKNQDTIFTWIFPWNARCLEYLGDCGEKSEDICLTRIPAALRWPQLSLNRISPGHLINDFNKIATTGYYDRKNCLNCSLSFVINNAGIRFDIWKTICAYDKNRCYVGELWFLKSNLLSHGCFAQTRHYLFGKICQIFHHLSGWWRWLLGSVVP